MKTVEELKADPQTAEAEVRVKKAGITDAWWSGLLKRVADLPARHARYMTETQNEAINRRSGLAIRMRALASEIADDQDASHLYPKYGGIEGLEPILCTFQPHEKALSFSVWLVECAEWLEAGPYWAASVAPFETRRGHSLKRSD